MSPPGALVRAMLALRQQGRTGIMKIDAEGTRTFVYLKDGAPVFAEEGSGGETLGRLLVRLRRLSQQQYLEVLSKMTDALVYNEQIRFGETAVELGLLSEAEVWEALQNQVRWKVIRCFQREELTWTFEDGRSLVEDAGNFPMTIESLVHDAALWLENERRMELGLAGVLDKYVLVPAEQRAGLAKRLGLTDQVAARLAVLDGDKRVREILGQAFGSELEPVITALSLLGLGVFSSDKQAPSAAKAPPAAPPSDPRYQRAPPPPAFDRRRTSEVLRQIGSVARALQTNDADIFREPSSEHEGRLLAEQAFQRGRAHFDASRFPQASSAFRRAVQLAPANAEYALFALWCDSRDKLADAGAALQLRRAAANAVRSDPNCAFGCYVLGRLAFAANDFDKAGRFFRRASVLDPAMTDAERYLRVAGSRIKPSR